MIAERIRCTEADLSAAYRMQGLRPPDGSGDGSAATASISPDSGLVGSHGSLTAVARMILPVLAHPQRIITVSSTTVGQATANAAMILAPYSGGPYVVRGDRDGQVDLVALDSSTAVVSLLDELMMITGLPTTSRVADVHLDRTTWRGLLAAADAERAAQLESQLARGADPTPTFDAARLEHLIDQALDADDTRWILGAEALVDRSFVEEGRGTGSETQSGLLASGLAEPVGNMARLTNAGRAWTGKLSTFVRLSHVRILQVIDGAPVDVVGMTFFRSPTDVVVAQTGTNDVTLMTLHADVATATLRAALQGPAATDVGTQSTQTISADPPHASTSEAEWVYVLDPVEVRGLYDTAVAVGMLQPGTWYLMSNVEGDWARVADGDGTLDGWADAAKLHAQDEPPPVADPLLAQDPTPAWHADHLVPPEGVPMWATPDPASAVVGTIPGGTEVRTLQVLGAWTRVQTVSGTEGWVDGRRLVAVDEETTESHKTPAAAPPVAAAHAGQGDPVVAVARSKPVQLVAAIAVAVSAFLPWFGDLAGPGDMPVTFLWNLEPGESFFSITLLVLLVGIGAVATVLSSRLNRYQSVAGGIATGIATIWLIQTFRVLLEWRDGAFGTAVADMFTEVLSFGPWVALAAGITLLVRR